MLSTLSQSTRPCVAVGKMSGVACIFLTYSRFSTRLETNRSIYTTGRRTAASGHKGRKRPFDAVTHRVLTTAFLLLFPTILPRGAKVIHRANAGLRLHVTPSERGARTVRLGVDPVHNGG